jgi:tetratricopeptide (TPR) repeat protein
VLVALGMARSAERHRVWRNEAFFTVRTVQDAPRSYRARRAYGEVLFLLGRQDLALEAYERAKALAPAGNVWRVRNDLARRYRAMGESEREVGELQKSLAEAPGQEDTRGHLIAAYLLLGRYADAARQIDTALARGGQPQVFRGLRALADSAARAGAPPGSIRVRPVTDPTG